MVYVNCNFTRLNFFIAVNRNLVGGSSYLSTDQKKKLLWGNKKNTSTEEVNCPSRLYQIITPLLLRPRLLSKVITLQFYVHTFIFLPCLPIVIQSFSMATVGQSLGLAAAICRSRTSREVQQTHGKPQSPSLYFVHQTDQTNKR